MPEYPVLNFDKAALFNRSTKSSCPRGGVAWIARYVRGVVRVVMRPVSSSATVVTSVTTPTVLTRLLIMCHREDGSANGENLSFLSIVIFSSALFSFSLYAPPRISSTNINVLLLVPVILSS